MLMKKVVISSLVVTGFLSLTPVPTYAHCPLCVAGAGVVAGLAGLLGVKYGAIGVFMGAFAVAMALWIPKLIKKCYIPHQNKILSALLYASTVIPIMLLYQDYGSIYISWGGNYGSLFNSTYLIDWFLIGIIIGTVILLASPWLSRQLTITRKGKAIRFQGMIIIFTILILAAVIMQVLR